MNTQAATQNTVNTFFISTGKTGTRFTLRRSEYDVKRKQITTVHVRNLGVSLDVALKTAEDYVKEKHPEAIFCKEIGHIEATPRRSTMNKQEEKQAYIDAVIALGVLSCGKYKGKSVEDVPESYLRWSWENRQLKENPTTNSDADVKIMFDHIKARKLDEKFAQEVALKC